MLLVDKAKCYLIVGKSILSETPLSLLHEATIALLASFYLLDFDYPRSQEIGLSILQYFVFKDPNVPEDITGPYKSAMKSYCDFKSQQD